MIHLIPSSKNLKIMKKDKYTTSRFHQAASKNCKKMPEKKIKKFKNSGHLRLSQHLFDAGVNMGGTGNRLCNKMKKKRLHPDCQMVAV